MDFFSLLPVLVLLLDFTSKNLDLFINSSVSKSKFILGSPILSREALSQDKPEDLIRVAGSHATVRSPDLATVFLEFGPGRIYASLLIAFEGWSLVI
jgi:hypothetical protein